MSEAGRSEEGARLALEKIQRELGPGFDTRAVDGLFFIATNGGLGALDDAENTIRLIRDHLYSEFMGRRLSRPVRVYCLRNNATYTEYVRDAYGREPTTPYGFYMAAERKMVLNLGTGKGTLAHEIVHPLVGEDFPGVPAWFNEGFAALFERMKPGTTVPIGNWRIAGLRRAREERREVALKTLMETNTDEFYGESRGVHYATARYLCLYLQTRQLLPRFYREFRDSANRDPTGIRSLERVTGKTLTEFETEWWEWVLKQR